MKGVTDALILGEEKIPAAYYVIRDLLIME